MCTTVGELFVLRQKSPVKSRLICLPSGHLKMRPLPTDRLRFPPDFFTVENLHQRQRQ